jgi:hypothetical protein
MDTKGAFRISYYASLPVNDSQLPHKQRDGDAFIELMEPLRDSGYRYSGLILNPPADSPQPPGSEPAAAYDFKSDDLLVLTTRPPLLDDATKRRIRRSHTVLEAKVLDVVQAFFSTCNVDHIVLAPHLVHAMRDDTLRGRSDAVFWTNQSMGANHARSAYRAYRQAHSDARRTEVNGKATPRTLAYLLFLPQEAWPCGPGLLCSFSVGGPQTLVWNHMLRTREELKHLILDSGPRFAIADLAMTPPASGQWLDLTPSLTWHVTYEAIPLVRSHDGGWAATREGR